MSAESEAAWVAKQLASAPPLSESQRHDLAVLAYAADHPLEQTKQPA